MYKSEFSFIFLFHLLFSLHEKPLVYHIMEVNCLGNYHIWKLPIFNYEYQNAPSFCQTFSFIFLYSYIWIAGKTEVTLKHTTTTKVQLKQTN